MPNLRYFKVTSVSQKTQMLVSAQYRSYLPDKIPPYHPTDSSQYNVRRIHLSDLSMSNSPVTRISIILIQREVEIRIEINTIPQSSRMEPAE